VIMVVDDTAPGGTSSFAELSARATVPPADGVTDALAVCVFVLVVVLGPPPPHPTRPEAATPTMLKRRTNRCRRPARDMTPREVRVGERLQPHRTLPPPP
jgi:hypothetical protein